MATINNTAETLFQGLSSFWARMFGDRDTIVALFQGQEQMLGQAYLDLLESVLGRSLVEVPVFHKEYWKLIVLRSDAVRFIPGASSADDIYLVPLPDSVVDFQFLQNKVFSPSVLLEKGYDFTLDTTGDPVRIAFKGTNPFARSGVPSNLVDVVPVTKATGIDGVVTSGSAVFTSVTGAAQFNSYNVGDTLALTSYTQGGSYKIIAVDPITKALTLDKTFTTAEIELSWSLLGPSSVKQIAMWAPDARIDKKTLADAYGFLISRERASSEQYRAFLRGVFQFFMLGPSLGRVDAALNVAIGIPVTQDDGETITSLPTDQVVTDKRTYSIPAGLRRTDLNIGDVLLAFTSLSTAFYVADYISDPTWWWNITIPSSVLPSEPAYRRQVNPDLYNNTFDNPPGLVKYGDPGLFYGADDSGALSPGTRKPLRHLFAYVLMDQLLKFNMFGIFTKPGIVPIDFGSSTIGSIIDVGKSAYVFLYAAPVAQFIDNATLTDSLSVLLRPPDEAIVQANDLVSYGDSMTYANNYYYYDGFGVLQTGVGVPNLALGQMPVVFGGASPFKSYLNGTESVYDWPVGVTSH